MNKGTKAILAASMVIAAFLGALPLYYAHDCETRHAEWATNQSKEAAASSSAKASQQGSKREDLPIDPNKVIWDQQEPFCESMYDGAVRGAFIALYTFITLFLGLHVCWLIVRAYKKLMKKLL